jgi:hypothetical protein
LLERRFTAARGGIGRRSAGLREALEERERVGAFDEAFVEHPELVGSDDRSVVTAGCSSTVGGPSTLTLIPGITSSIPEGTP